MNTTSRKDFALDFFQKLNQKISSSEGPPPLGLHLVMKESLADKMKNLLKNIQSNRVAPFEIIAKHAE